MKKLFLFFLLFSFAYAEKIGVVDFEKIFNTYNKAVQLNDDFIKNKKIYEKNIKNLEEKYSLKKKQASSTIKSKKKLELRLKELDKEFQKNLKNSQAEFYPKYQTQFYLVILEVEASSILFAEQNGYDYIFDKKSLVHGGNDITDSILSFMSFSEDFELKDPLLLNQ